MTTTTAEQGRPTPFSRALAVAAVITAVALVACGDDGSGTTTAAITPAPGAGVFVGKVEGTEAYIAVASNGKRVAGYVCDGEQVSRWFASTALAGRGAELSSRNGDALGDVTINGNAATGKVSVNGESHAFAANLAEGEAGLYHAIRGNLEAGWIVLADGGRRGSVNHGTAIRPAPTLNTRTLTASDFRRVDRVSGDGGGGVGRAEGDGGGGVG